MRNAGRKYFLEKSQLLFGFSFGLHIAGQCCGRIQSAQILPHHIQPYWNSITTIFKAIPDPLQRLECFFYAVLHITVPFNVF